MDPRSPPIREGDMLAVTWNGKATVAGVPLLPVPRRSRIAARRRLRRQKHGY